MKKPSAIFHMSFKEFKETQTAGEKIHTAAIKMAESDAKAFGNDFNHFLESQKPEVKKALTPIAESCRKETKNIEETAAFWSGFLSQDMLKLQGLHTLLLKEQAALQAKVDAAKKSKAIAEKNDANVSKARQKNNAADIAKYEAQVQSTHQRAEDDQKAEEEARIAYNTYFEDYKSKFIDQLATNVRTFADARQKELDQLSVFADEISNSILLIAEPEEVTIPHLKQRLQELESITID